MSKKSNLQNIKSFEYFIKESFEKGKGEDAQIPHPLEEMEEEEEEEDYSDGIDDKEIDRRNAEIRLRNEKIRSRNKRIEDSREDHYKRISGGKSLYK